MSAAGMQFSWRWDGGTISTQLDVIWGMSVHTTFGALRAKACHEPRSEGMIRRTSTDPEDHEWNVASQRFLPPM